MGRAFAEAHGLCDRRQPGLGAAAAWSLSVCPTCWAGSGSPLGDAESPETVDTVSLCSPPHHLPCHQLSPLCAWGIAKNSPNSPKPRNHGMHFLYKGPTKKGPGAGSSASGDNTWDRTALCHWDPAPESSLMVPFQPQGERGPAESARPEPVTQVPSLLKAHQPLL